MPISAGYWPALLIASVVAGLAWDAAGSQATFLIGAALSIRRGIVRVSFEKSACFQMTAGVIVRTLRSHRGMLPPKRRNP